MSWDKKRLETELQEAYEASRSAIKQCLQFHRDHKREADELAGANEMHLQLMRRIREAFPTEMTVNERLVAIEHRLRKVEGRP